jgi:hypothetical protein
MVATLHSTDSILALSPWVALVVVVVRAAVGRLAAKLGQTVAAVGRLAGQPAPELPVTPLWASLVAPV